MDDYDDEDWICPVCGKSECVRSRDCGNCDDGYIDLGEMDWQDEGEYAMCQECHGQGRVRWCSNCGADLQLPKWREAMEPQFEEARFWANREDAWRWA